MSQIKAAVAVNQELIKLHWWIGREIVSRQETEKWGGQVIENSAKTSNLDSQDSKDFQDLTYLG